MTTVNVFPGSKDPGPIEADIATAYALLISLFPGSKDPGPIEAYLRGLRCAGRAAISGVKRPRPH